MNVCARVRVYAAQNAHTLSLPLFPFLDRQQKISTCLFRLFVTVRTDTFSAFVFRIEVGVQTSALRSLAHVSDTILSTFETQPQTRPRDTHTYIHILCIYAMCTVQTHNNHFSIRVRDGTPQLAVPLSVCIKLSAW